MQHAVEWFEISLNCSKPGVCWSTTPAFESLEIVALVALHLHRIQLWCNHLTSLELWSCMDQLALNEIIWHYVVLSEECCLLQMPPKTLYHPVPADC